MSQSMADLFKSITTGVHVIGVADGEIRNAFTAAWVMQVSFRPLMLALSINPDHKSHALLVAGRHFSVNVLDQRQMDLAAHFGQSTPADKLAGLAWQPGAGGAPLLDEALAQFECECAGEMPAGDHVVVIGRVINGRLLDPARVPLTYRETGNLDNAAAIFPERFE